jgi:hypothetical protein
MRIVLQLGAATAVCFLTLEALYWPLIMKPGTELAFWQIYWAAQLGKWAGLPVVAAILVSPLSGLWQEALAIVLTAAWAAVVYWLVGLALRRRNVAGGQSAT